MRFAIVTHGLPQPSTNGGPMTCWAVLTELHQRGHRVSVVALEYPGDPFAGPARRERVETLGAELWMVRVNGSNTVLPRPRGLVQRVVDKGRWFADPRLEAHFPTASLAPRVAETLRAISADAVFVYHWDSLATLHELDMYPRLAAVGDPWHLPNFRRWQQATPALSRSYLNWTLSTARAGWHTRPLMVRLLEKCDAAGCFQADAAAWLQRLGARRCEYFPTPIADDTESRWRRRWEAPPRSRPTILLGPSNLQATSTSAGLRLFAQEIYPRLERALGPNGFEVRVVGEGSPPPELAALAGRSSIRLCGRIEPADSEFLSADVQLVPTPIVLGIRVRILVGWSFGCCVVAHRADAANIPEMIHEHNALLAGDGRGLAEMILQAFGDPSLRQRLGANARATYERHFAPPAAAAPLVDRLEFLARGRMKRPHPVGTTLGVTGG